jgi:hypothetical protein
MVTLLTEIMQLSMNSGYFYFIRCGGLAVEAHSARCLRQLAQGLRGSRSAGMRRLRRQSSRMQMAQQLNPLRKPADSAVC